MLASRAVISRARYSEKQALAYALDELTAARNHVRGVAEAQGLTHAERRRMNSVERRIAELQLDIRRTRL